MVAPWHASFLGGFTLVRGGECVEQLRSRKTEALLACLAAAPGRKFSRDELIARFWPDDPVERGQTSLRVALYRLRAALGKGVIESGRAQVALVPGTLESDVEAFDLAVRRGDASGALALYRGPYLPGVYDDATVRERERLEELVARMRERAATLESASPRLALPGYLTGFLVRDGELAALEALIRERRLVTLFGPGGVGKTRLAIELARSRAADFSRIAFVALEECVDAARLPERLCAALGLVPGDAPPLEALTTLLHGLPVLLVLDNLEQLIESGIADGVERLLMTIPTLRIVATSRRLLEVPGEQAFPLAPLSIAQSRALFADRARSSRPDFTVEKNPSLDALCLRLDGIPLALELAASRLRSQSVLEILEQLERGASPLAHPEKLARHASLEQAIAWSWRLLPAHQQTFAARLTVFREGWSAEAAAAVTEYADARERLAALVDASLVVSEETVSGRTRFRFLETIRAFAAERLEAREKDETRARHREFFQRSVSPEEGENVLAALISAREDGDTAAAYRLLARHGQGALARLGAPLCLRECRATLARSAPDAPARLGVLSLAVRMAGELGERVQADALADEALALAGADPGLRAVALSIRGQVAVARDAPPEESIPILREALALAESVGDGATGATALRRLGIQLRRLKRLDEALDCFVRSESLCAALGDDAGVRYALANRAHLLQQQQAWEPSLALYQICLERARAAGDWSHEGILLNNISMVLDELGRWDESLRTLQACLKIRLRLGDGRGVALALWNVPANLLLLGHPKEAATLMRFASDLWDARFGPLSIEDAAERDGLLARCAVEGKLPTLTLDEAVALALSF